MRNSFSFGELGNIITASKKPDIVKIASAAGEKTAVAEAMETICSVADELDNVGQSDLADKLMSATKSLIDETLKTANLFDVEDLDDMGPDDKKDGKDGDEDEKDKDGKDKDADIEEVLPITCPHCGKDFDVVIENEDGEIEVESKEEDDKERGDEKGEIDDAFMTVGLPGLGAPGA